MAILMGIIQGVAEFLPISSSGHLALFQQFFGMENMEEKYMMFTVMLHFGTLISVLVVYWKDVVEMIREFFLGIAALAGKDTGTPPPPARRMVMLIIIATLPLFVMVLLQDAVNALFASSIMVSIALLATGCILFFSDRLAHGRKTAKNATITDALIVGCSQALAVIPGLSRSGTTISTGLMLGIKKSAMAQFSFLMVLIPILGEAFLQLVGGDFSASSSGISAISLALGTLTAFVSGYVACRWMIRIVQKARLRWFALYCVLAAAFCFIFETVG